MVDQNMSAIPQLALPQWLRAWSVRRTAPHFATRPVLVLAFGMVRSVAMLNVTMQSLERHAPVGAALVVRAYASAPIFAAAHARIDRTTLQLKSIALFDVRTKRAPGIGACAGDARRAAEHQNELDAAALLLHLSSYEWNAWNATGAFVVLWRIDTELVSDVELPIAELIAEDVIAVPHLQSGGFLNDRYLTANAHAVRRIVTARAALLDAECVYGESALVRLVHELRLRVAFTRTRTVRRRANLFIPDVDRAASLGTIKARSWMLRINTIAPTLTCDEQAAVCTINNVMLPTAEDRVFGVHGRPKHNGCPFIRAWESRCVWRSSAREIATTTTPVALPVANASRTTRRLLVLGDSMDAQLFVATVCHLYAQRDAGLRLELAFEAEWQNNVQALRKRCGADGALRCHYERANLNVGGGTDSARVPFVSMHLCQGDRFDCLETLRFDPAHDVVVTGADSLHGLAHKLPRAFMRGVPNATLVRAAAKRDARSVLKVVPPKRLIWREGTAQHFDAQGGHWKHGFMLQSNVENLNKRCVDSPIEDMRKHAHWNAAVAPLMRQHGVQVLQTWEESARAWYMHLDHGDCTHFCQPSTLMNGWAQTLLRMVASV